MLIIIHSVTITFIIFISVLSTILTVLRDVKLGMCLSFWFKMPFINWILLKIVYLNLLILNILSTLVFKFKQFVLDDIHCTEIFHLNIHHSKRELKAEFFLKTWNSYDLSAILEISISLIFIKVTVKMFRKEFYFSFPKNFQLFIFRPTKTIKYIK